MRLFILVLSGFVVIASCGFFAAISSLEKTYRSAALEVCDLIDEHFYLRHQPNVRAFIAKCRDDASKQSFLVSKSANVRRINQRLSELKTSHLSLYNPEENRQLWENSGKDTGIRSRIVEEYLVVTRVLPKSPASFVGIKPGDVLAAIDGEVISSPFDAQSGSGLFQVVRGDSTFSVEIIAEEIQENLAPTLTDLGGGTGLLKIPSFLSQYFDRESWGPLSIEIGRFERLIVDVRDNAGGSFPGMLRALSPFECGARLIGEIYRSPREGLAAQVDLLDNLNAESQISQLDSAIHVRLKSFDDYGCFQGPVTVLIDSGTSSVAEIFAQAFFTRPRSRVWGQPSSGQVVMARWFNVNGFGGEDFALAVPIAGYRPVDGEELESRGVTPQRLLFYDLERSLTGHDSWIEEAKSGFHSGTGAQASQRLSP